VLSTLNEAPILESNLTDENSTQSIDNILAESKQNIEEATLNAQPKKRGRKSKAELAAMQAAEEEAKLSAPSPVQVPSSALVPAIEMPFNIAAKRTGFDGWKLSVEESTELAPMLEAVLKTYAPQMESRHAALASFCLSIAIVTATRYMHYLDFVSVQKRDENTRNNHESMGQGTHGTLRVGTQRAE